MTIKCQSAMAQGDCKEWFVVQALVEPWRTLSSVGIRIPPTGCGAASAGSGVDDACGGGGGGPLDRDPALRGSGDQHQNAQWHVFRNTLMDQLLEISKCSWMLTVGAVGVVVGRCRWLVAVVAVVVVEHHLQ